MYNHVLMTLCPRPGFPSGDQIIFWLTVVFDLVLLCSLVFAAFYAAWWLILHALPHRWLTALRGWWLPVLLVAAVVAVPWVNERLCAALLPLCAPIFLSIPWVEMPMTLAMIWAAGVAINLVCLVVRYLRLGGTLARYPLAPPDTEFVRAFRDLGMSRQVLIKTCGGKAPLSSWGLGNAVILTPEGFTAAFDAEERYLVYVHELTHIRNRDSLKGIALNLLATLWWFNPAVHHCLTLFRNHMELTCDRDVLRRTRVEPLDYAELLGRAVTSGGGLMHGFSRGYMQVCERLALVLGDPGLVPMKKTRMHLAFGVVLALSLVAVIRAGGANPPAPLELPDTVIPPLRPGETAIAARPYLVRNGLLGGYIVILPLEAAPGHP